MCYAVIHSICVGFQPFHGLARGLYLGFQLGVLLGQGNGYVGYYQYQCLYLGFQGGIVIST